MSTNKKVTFIITRQDNPESQPYEEKFILDYRPNMNVISALMEIRRNPVNAEGKKTTPVIWDMNCLKKVSDTCYMVINNTPKQSYTDLINQLEQPIHLAPMNTFPVVHNLIMDGSKMFDSM